MISILIPIYNVSQFILRCLESVAAQSYDGDVECVLIDDCGKDDSMAIAEEFIAHQPSRIKFRIIHHNQNRGLAAARNTGVHFAEGDFVMHLDSDDWLEPDAVALLVNKQIETNADIVSGNALAHYESGVKLFEEPEYSDNMEMVRKTIQMSMDHVIWRRLIRKSLYVDNQIRAVEGVNIGEDHHTLPRLAYFAHSIAKVDAVIYHYNCLNPHSYMQKSKRKICMKTYDNNCRSIQILKSFFADKDKEVVDELESIESRYKINMRRRAIQLRDYDHYIQLCNDQNIKENYQVEQLKFKLFSVMDRLKNILKVL